MENPVRIGPQFNTAVGVGYILFLWLINIFGSVFMLGPVLPLLFVQPAWFRFYEDFCFATGIFFSCWVMEVVWGVKFVGTGDAIRAERALTMMNHRTNFDWLFYWDFISFYGDPRRLKIMLKATLRKIFGFSWIAQLTGYLFLRRKFEDDQATLHRVLTLYCKIPNYPYHCLIFPEGTDLNPRSRQGSDRWAAKLGVPGYQYCLHPRTTGLVYCLRVLRGQRGIDAVYDMTMAYLEGPVVSKLGLLKGQPPHEVHIHVRRVPIADIPETDEGVEKWCQAAWGEKEKLLEAFHREKKFPGPPMPVNASYPLYRTLAVLYWAFYVP
eukprot:EG_transcript_19852